MWKSSREQALWVVQAAKRVAAGRKGRGSRTASASSELLCSHGHVSSPVANQTTRLLFGCCGVHGERMLCSEVQHSPHPAEGLNTCTLMATNVFSCPAHRMALAMLAFYRNGISPLMPSSCRYIPTCSNYSIDSYKKFGKILAL